MSTVNFKIKKLLTLIPRCHFQLSCLVVMAENLDHLPWNHRPDVLFLLLTQRKLKTLFRNESFWRWVSDKALLIFLTLFYPGSGKTLLPGPGGGHYGPPLVFWLWGHQKSKTEPWHIFGPKNYLRSHFEHF